MDEGKEIGMKRRKERWREGWRDGGKDGEKEGNGGMESRQENIWTQDTHQIFF